MAAFTGVALAAGRWGVAALLVTGFHCLLRTGEVTSLQRRQVDLRADGCGVIALPPTKATFRLGAQEMVTVDDPFVGRLLLRCLSVARGAQPFELSPA